MCSVVLDDNFGKQVRGEKLFTWRGELKSQDDVQ